MDRTLKFALVGFLAGLLLILWGWSGNGRYEFRMHDLIEQEKAASDLPGTPTIYTYWTVYDTRSGSISEYKISNISGQFKSEWTTHHVGRD